MTVVDFLMMILIFVIGMVMGGGLAMLAFSDAQSGDLVILKDDETGEEYMFLELDENVEKLKRRGHASLSVKVKKR